MLFSACKARPAQRAPRISCAENAIAPNSSATPHSITASFSISPLTGRCIGPVATVGGGRREGEAIGLACARSKRRTAHRAVALLPAQVQQATKVLLCGRFEALPE